MKVGHAHANELISENVNPMRLGKMYKTNENKSNWLWNRIGHIKLKLQKAYKSYLNPKRRYQINKYQQSIMNLKRNKNQSNSCKILNAHEKLSDFGVKTYSSGGAVCVICIALGKCERSRKFRKNTWVWGYRWDVWWVDGVVGGDMEWWE